MVKVKGKSKCLTLCEKAKIIEDVEKGVNVTLLAKKYGIAKSTVCAIKNKKRDILESVSRTVKSNKFTRKCTLKKAELPEMEKVLYRWFINLREKNIPVSGDMIKQKALSISASLNIGDFRASDGWLQRFKNRYGVRFLKICGEKLSSQPELIDPFKDTLRKLIREHGFNEHQIYNADETGLFWRLLPDKTYVSLAEKTAPGLKIAKQRITFLGCVNASGLHKIKPLVIGKAKNPRCFKNFNNPVVYRNTKNAWMTAEIFKNWFFQQFIPEVRNFLKNQNLPEKALLLLDNAPSHPPAEELKSNDGKIFVMFMPPNVTPLIQPMDQNVLRLTKLQYRNSLLSFLVAGDQPLAEALKKITLKDAVIHLAAAWDKISPQIISKCWDNIMGSIDAEQEAVDEDEVPLSILRDQLMNKGVIDSVLGETITLLEAIEPAKYTRQDIEDWNRDECRIEEVENESDESDCEILEEEPIRVTHSEAVKSLDIAIKWAQQNYLPVSEMITLKNIQEKAILAKLSTKQKQSKITSFFHCDL